MTTQPSTEQSTEQWPEQGTEPERIPSTAYFITRMIAYNPLRYGVVALCWILFHTWPLVPGLLAKAFFDTLAGNAPAGFTLWSILALVFAAGLIRAAIVGAAALAGTPWIFMTQELLQRNLLSHILVRPGAKAIPGTVGEALSTLRDDVEIMRLMSDWAFDLLAGLIFAVGGIAILLWVDARITLLIFIPIVLVILLANAVRARTVQVREQSREATARVTGLIGEIFGKVQTVQIAGAETWMLAQLQQRGDERGHAMLRDRLQELTLDAVFTNIASMGAGLTLLVAAGQMRSGSFSVGDFALFATYLMQVADYTGFLGYLINTYRQAGVAFQRALKLLQDAPATSLVAHHPPSVQENPTPDVTDCPLQTLEVQGLTFHYPESQRGIEDVTFTLERGSITVITGAIGSGKTTLVRTLLGLLPAQAGQLRWNGQRIDRPGEFLVPPHVAYTAQVPMLLSGTLRENILLGLEVETWELEEAITTAVLEQDIAGFPQGLESEIGVRGLRLSGGQVQRTAAARMVVRKSELLVIDDLSSALDQETEQRLWQRILALNTTCLIISHRPFILTQADQVLVLEDGRIVS
jgi:ATP-binding cassette, subfamily B, bacterial